MKKTARAPTVTLHTCADCKHLVMVTDAAHRTQCARYGVNGATIPCVAARGSEDLCGGMGKGWQPG